MTPYVEPGRVTFGALLQYRKGCITAAGYEGTVKLTDFLQVPLIDMRPKSLICCVGSN